MAMTCIMYYYEGGVPVEWQRNGRWLDRLVVTSSRDNVGLVRVHLHRDDSSMPKRHLCFRVETKTLVLDNKHLICLPSSSGTYKLHTSLGQNNRPSSLSATKSIIRLNLYTFQDVDFLEE